MDPIVYRREDIPYIGRCVTPGCTWKNSPKLGYHIEWLKGWFRDHVEATGHTVVIEDHVAPAAVSEPSA